jgi:hypothetical protein
METHMKFKSLIKSPLLLCLHRQWAKQNIVIERIGAIKHDKTLNSKSCWILETKILIAISRIK